MPVPLFYFYDSLARLARYVDTPEEQRTQILEKVDANQAKLQNWATHAPMNYRHKWQLVEAERARVLGRSGEAREHYDQAIALAEQYGYLNEEALAHELAGRFYLEKGLTQFAQLCLHNAHYAFGRWGALAKVRDIEDRYSDYFRQRSTSGAGWHVSPYAQGYRTERARGGFGECHRAKVRHGTMNL